MKITKIYDENELDFLLEIGHLQTLCNVDFKDQITFSKNKKSYR